MSSRTIDEKSHGQTVFMARITKKCSHGKEVENKEKCVQLIKVDMQEVMMYKAVKKYTLTWMAE